VSEALGWVVLAPGDVAEEVATIHIGGGMSDPAFSRIQLVTDLAVTTVGSFIAVVGALLVANSTFRRDIREERRRSFLALMVEFDGNLEAIEYMVNDPTIMFPLEHHVLDQAIEHVEVVPTHVGKMIQEAAMFIARFNASNPLNLEALVQVRIPLHNAEVARARFLKGDTSLPPEWLLWAGEEAEGT
jgi:hypothetical protein